MTTFAKIDQKLDKVRHIKHLKRSTIVENVRQIDLFLQNKANSYKAKLMYLLR
jgi:hypothetical protein